MHAYVTPALYCLFVWWFSTGVIVFLNNLPVRTFKWSLGLFSVVAMVSLYRLEAGNHDTSVAGAYAAFTYGVLVWGWHEMAFFMGALTGPRKTAAPPGVGEWERFRMGAAACIDHELAILATAIVVLWATWGAPNQVGCWTFMALWGMRQSAKLNVFLGVLNLGEAFVPAHLHYLISFMTCRRMNWLMPFSLVGGSLLVAFLVHKASAPGVTAFQSAGYGCLVTMLALAVLEHALLVLPLPFTALWGFWLRHAETSAQPTVVGVAEPTPVVQNTVRRKPGWATESNFNLSPAKSAI
jgi:putative photosynthetic complex assembly protein 2